MGKQMRIFTKYETCPKCFESMFAFGLCSGCGYAYQEDEWVIDCSMGDDEV